MAMTKKDYEAIAEAIKAQAERPEWADKARAERVECLRNVACAVADHAATRDRAFKRVRFLKACGVAYPDCEGGRLMRKFKVSFVCGVSMKTHVVEVVADDEVDALCAATTMHHDCFLAPIVTEVL